MLGLNGVMSQDCPEKFWSGSVVLIRQHRPELAAAVGNTVEWFDFAIFGYFARTIGSQFFPAGSPTLQLLGAFSVFAVDCLMRPIGSLLLMPVMLYSGVYPSLLPFLFPAGMRCSSFSFSYSLIVALLGGTAPLVATWLLQSLRLDYAPALYCLLWVPPTLWALHRFKAIDGNRRQDSVS